MRVRDLTSFALRSGASVIFGDPDIEVTGWEHCEDAHPGCISWLRNPIDSFAGSALVCGPKSLRPTPTAQQTVIVHPSPRDLIASMLHLDWGCRLDDIAPGTSGYSGSTTAQDYIWRERWVPLKSTGAVRIGQDVTIGDRAWIVPGTVGMTTIKHGCRIGHGVNIGHDARIGEHSLIIAHSRIGGWARIERKVKIYMGAMVKNGVTVGDGAVIGMGSVVLEDVPAGETWAGNPARRI